MGLEKSTALARSGVVEKGPEGSDQGGKFLHCHFFIYRFSDDGEATGQELTLCNKAISRVGHEGHLHKEPQSKKFPNCDFETFDFSFHTPRQKLIK